LWKSLLTRSFIPTSSLSEQKLVGVREGSSAGKQRLALAVLGESSKRLTGEFVSVGLGVSK